VHECASGLTSTPMAELFCSCRKFIGRAAESVEIGKELPGKLYMLVGNYHSAIQVNSSNCQELQSKSPNGLYSFPCWVMMAQYLALWRNSYTYLTIVVSCSCWSCARLQIWYFWSQILKFCF